MSRTNQDELKGENNSNSVWQNKRVRRLILYAAVLIIVFLAGLVPMWLTSRRYARERDAAQASLQISDLQTPRSQSRFPNHLCAVNLCCKTMRTALHFVGQ